MVDPYKMVAINITAVLFLSLGVLFYRYIYPKKNINLLMLLILTSLLPLISLLRIGTYESGDLSQNVFKSMEFYSSLQEGSFIPRWAGDLNATFGYPLFIFIYPLPYYIISFFHFVGFSFIASIKLLIAFSFILSGIGMFLFVKEDFSDFPAFVASIFYLYSPYHLIDMHLRVSIGEVVSFAILPLNLLLANKLSKYGSAKYLVLTTFSLFLLFLANPAISLISSFVIVLYAIFTWSIKKNRKLVKLLPFFISFFLALGLSAFYWIPAILESKYTHEALYVSKISFVTIRQLLYSPWRYGLLFQGPKGELSFLIGYAQIAVVIICLLLFLKKRFNRYQEVNLIFYLILLSSIFFLLLPVSSFIWNGISILKNFQFTYRMLFFVALFTALLSGVLATKLNKKIILIILTVAVLQTILNWGNRRTIPSITDSILRSRLPLSTSAGEGFQPAAPIWVNPKNPWMDKIPKNHIEILKGNAKISIIKRTDQLHEYNINASEITNFRENTLYFPGWRLYANDKEIPLSISKYPKPGIIEFRLDKGSYDVKLKFQDTPVVKISKIISLLSLLTIIAVLISSFMQRRILPQR